MVDPTVAVLTITHGRHDHLARQQDAVADWTPVPRRVVVSMGDEEVRDWTPRRGPRPEVLVMDADPGDLPLARARNLAAEHAVAAGASVLVFLDVDVIPGTELQRSYVAAVQQHPRTIWSGPVTYLAPPPSGGYPDAAALAAWDDPHPARPAPAPGELVHPADPNKFWSLSFALSSDLWRETGGFCEEYSGYGAEDTDFARAAAQQGIEFGWCGGARAFHQYHPVSSPPTEHVDSIVRNAQIFHRRWGVWPMETWLREFEDLGLVERSTTGFTLR